MPPKPGKLRENERLTGFALLTVIPPTDLHGLNYEVQPTKHIRGSWVDLSQAHLQVDCADDSVVTAQIAFQLG